MPYMIQRGGWKMQQNDLRPADAGYFPLFIDLWKKKVLIVGAGEIARRRIRTLLPFQPEIVVVAPFTGEKLRTFLKDMEIYRLKKDRKLPEGSLSGNAEPDCCETVCGAEPDHEKSPAADFWVNGLLRIRDREYDAADCAGAFLVLAATDDPELNARICRDAHAAGAFANNASDRTQCDFYFPSIVRDGDHVIGINGGGEDHAGTKQLREQVERLLQSDGG